MFKRMNPVIWGLFAMLVAVQSVAASSLDTLGAGTQALDKHTGKGKWLVVMLWASDCHVCNEEVEQYNAFHLNRHDKDAEVLGVSLDGRQGQADAESFLQRHDVKFPNLIGEPEQVARLYNQQTGSRWIGTPSFLVYSPTGELMARQAGAVPVELIESFISKHAAK
ncbi:TlpA family protein disulfide reductase [Solemya velesiana gill symbiont]|uniref:Thioredoxin domain-containing protein n=1 Tax=Solemya velesiana gill symbiont TaxID=1918948 RepID=A0A1T2KYG0_9GAMM|nr:TlpA disulfide reductase family protein [Solemya velesiana gill symbiont]OOZ37756.1 hypothetical protein BOW51_01095 [Solemya velesiana gill symbiont]